VVSTLAGAGGFRQGALNISVARQSGQSVTWDGNPDCALKILVTNYAANAAGEGACRAIDIQARNRGTNAGWVNSLNANVRNDSGKTTGSLSGIDIRIENYGTITTELVGININLSTENNTGAPLAYGLRIRNTDASGTGGATTAAIHISAVAPSPGIAAFVEFEADNTLNCVQAGGAGAATVASGQWRQIRVLIGTTAYFFPVCAAAWTNT